MQATLDAIIGDSQSAAISTNNITHIFHLRHVIRVSHNLNSNLA